MANFTTVTRNINSRDLKLDWTQILAQHTTEGHLSKCQISSKLDENCKWVYTWCMYGRTN